MHHKMGTKILANRIKRVLPAIISREQGAESRSIGDNILLATELHHSVIDVQVHYPLMLIKLDMAKAFDRVCWNYIEQVFHFLGFASRGYPESFFYLQYQWHDLKLCFKLHGLIQGCPLSPYLFCLCSEILSILLSRLELRRRFSGDATSCGGHLWYPNLSG